MKKMKRIEPITERDQLRGIWVNLVDIELGDLTTAEACIWQLITPEQKKEFSAHRIQQQHLRDAQNALSRIAKLGANPFTDGCRTEDFLRRCDEMWQIALNARQKYDADQEKEE